MFKLYHTRSFSENFSVCTAWLAHNWRPFFKFFTLLLLPFCVVQGYFTHYVMEIANKVGPNNNYLPSASDITNISLCYGISLIVTVISCAFFFALIKKTFIKHEELSTCSFKDILHATTKCLLPVLGYLMIMFVIISVFSCAIILFAITSPYTLIISIPLFIMVCIALLPFQPLFILTDEPFLEALFHAFRLGVKCWWGFFSTVLVMMIITLIIQILAYIPSYSVSAIDILMKMAGTKSSFFIDLLSYLANVFMVYVNHATSFLLVLIITIKYGHAIMKTDKEEPLDVED